MINDVKLNSWVGFTGSNVSSQSQNMITNESFNRALVVFVTMHATSTVTSISYGAQALTKLTEKNYAAGDNPRIEVWYLLNPLVGTYSLAVTLSGLSYFTVGAGQFSNVDQVNPFRSSALSSGTTSPMTVSLSGVVSRDMVIGAVCQNSLSSIVPDASQTAYFTGIFGGFRSSGTYALGSGTVVSSWTGGVNYAAVAVDLQNASYQYSAAVYTRTPADIVARNSRAFFNVSDWQRIYNNAILANFVVSEYLQIPYGFLGTGIQFDQVTPPTVSTYPTAADFNKLCANIERIRTTFSAGALASVRSNWQEGNYPSPDYVTINQLEKTLFDILDFFTQRHLRSGIMISGVGLTRNNRWR